MVHITYLSVLDYTFEIFSLKTSLGNVIFCFSENIFGNVFVINFIFTVPSLTMDLK